jgi:hypothetical protein
MTYKEDLGNAAECFAENARQTDMRDKPHEWNLYNGLTKLAEGLEKQFSEERRAIQLLHDELVALRSEMAILRGAKR